MTCMIIPVIGDEMSELVERYMDEETIRITCFFLRVKFDPENPCCKGCARYKFCLRDAKKMVAAIGYIPWLTKSDVKSLIEKTYGHQRCENCDL